MSVTWRSAWQGERTSGPLATSADPGSPPVRRDSSKRTYPTDRSTGRCPRPGRRYWFFSIAIGRCSHRKDRLCVTAFISARDMDGGVEQPGVHGDETVRDGCATGVMREIRGRSLLAARSDSTPSSSRCPFGAAPSESTAGRPCTARGIRDVSVSRASDGAGVRGAARAPTPWRGASQGFPCAADLRASATAKASASRPQRARGLAPPRRRSAGCWRCPRNRPTMAAARRALAKDLAKRRSCASGAMSWPPCRTRLRTRALPASTESMPTNTRITRYPASRAIRMLRSTSLLVSVDSRVNVRPSRIQSLARRNVSRPARMSRVSGAPPRSRAMSSGLRNGPVTNPSRSSSAWALDLPAPFGPPRMMSCLVGTGR